MTPRKVLPLALVGLVVIAAALIASLAGSQAKSTDPAPSAQRAEQEPRGEQAQPAETQRELPQGALPSEQLPAGPPLDDAEDLAARYALVATNWTPETFRQSRERQEELATGSWRQILEDTPVSQAEIDALAEEETSSRSQLLRLQRDTRVAEPEARVLVELKEATTALGQTVEGRTVHEVTLRRTDDGWGVDGYTIVPGAGG